MTKMASTCVWLGGKNCKLTTVSAVKFPGRLTAQVGAAVGRLVGFGVVGGLEIGVAGSLLRKFVACMEFVGRVVDRVVGR